MPKHKRAKWLKRIAIGSAAAILAGVGIAWMMVQHIPAWYRPVQIPPEFEQAVLNDVLVTCENGNTSEYEFIDGYGVFGVGLGEEEGVELGIPITPVDPNLTANTLSRLAGLGHSLQRRAGRADLRDQNQRRPG